LPRKLAQAHPHIDPDFKTATYGDAAPRKCRQLNKLMPHDFLVFYCGLAPFPPDDIARLFVIGYFSVKAVHRVSARDVETRRKLRHRFGTPLTSFSVRPTGSSC
jgi:Nucleotide modification associated domain 3